LCAIAPAVDGSKKRMIRTVTPRDVAAGEQIDVVGANRERPGIFDAFAARSIENSVSRAMRRD